MKKTKGQKERKTKLQKDKMTKRNIFLWLATFVNIRQRIQLQHVKKRVQKNLKTIPSLLIANIIGPLQFSPSFLPFPVSCCWWHFLVFHSGSSPERGLVFIYEQQNIISQFPANSPRKLGAKYGVKVYGSTPNGSTKPQFKPEDLHFMVLIMGFKNYQSTSREPSYFGKYKQLGV